MATWTNTSKSSAPTFTQSIRHGVVLLISDLQDKVFTDEYDSTGIAIKDTTFQAMSQSWTNQNKS